MDRIIPAQDANKRFDGCPFEDCNSDHRELRTVPAGTVLFEEGRPSDRLYCLHEGRIAVSRRDATGVLRVAALIEPGEFLAIDCLGAGSHHTSTAISIQASLLCVVHRSVLMEALKTDWRLVDRLMRGVCTRLDRIESHLGYT